MRLNRTLDDLGGCIRWIRAGEAGAPKYRQEFNRHGFKRVCRAAFFGLAFDGRIDAIGEILARFVPRLARLLERNVGVVAQRELLFLLERAPLRVAIFESPEPSAGGHHQQEQATLVGVFLRFFGGF